MESVQVEIKNIEKLFQDDPHLKPHEREIRRRYCGS